MEKFKAKHPSNADFEEKLAKYAKLADDVWRQVRNAQPCHNRIPCSVPVLAAVSNLHCSMLLCPSPCS